MLPLHSRGEIRRRRRSGPWDRYCSVLSRGVTTRQGHPIQSAQNNKEITLKKSMQTASPVHPVSFFFSFLGGGLLVWLLPLLPRKGGKWFASSLFSCCSMLVFMRQKHESSKTWIRLLFRMKRNKITPRSFRRMKAGCHQLYQGMLSF